MPQKNQKQYTSDAAVKDYVTVAFAEDTELAKQYQELLEDNDISSRIQRQSKMAESGFSDIAILVPEELLDEAHTLISERASYDDFFDMILDDSDREDIDFVDFGIDEDDNY